MVLLKFFYIMYLPPVGLLKHLSRDVLLMQNH